MTIDIVRPKDNEQEFLKMAKLLGYDSLIFLYEDASKAKSIKSDIKTYSALLSDKLPRKALLNISDSDDRKLIEKSRIDILFNQETYHRKDSMHFRYSGLNHINAKMMAENDIIYAISFNSILRAKERPKLLGKIMQNVMLCQKFKAKISIFSFAKTPYEMRAPKDMLGIFKILGADTKTQKNNFSNMMEKITYNEKLKKGKILGKGMEIVD
jgi:RNase P/RNase MRP subunit p30